MREAPQRAGKRGGFCAEEEDLLGGSGARDELDLAGRGGYRGQGPPRTPRKDGEVAKILKGKAHSAVGQ